jgi:hypothetical protein
MLKAVARTPSHLKPLPHPKALIARRRLNATGSIAPAIATAICTARCLLRRLAGGAGRRCAAPRVEGPAGGHVKCFSAPSARLWRQRDVCARVAPRSGGMRAPGGWRLSVEQERERALRMQRAPHSHP